MNCVFCAEVFRLIPGFYCRKVISVSGGTFPSPTRTVLTKAYEFGHDYTYSASKKSLSCDVCGKLFKKACNRERHFKNVHYKERHECLQCGKLFGRPDNLKTHMRVHVNESVAIDSTAYSTESDDDLSDASIEKDSFDTFIDEDKSDEEYVPDNCDDAKVCENIVKDSISDNSDSNGMSIIIKCDKCDKNFSSKFNLRAHERKIKYSCEKCQDSFCSRGGLSAHMKTKHGKQELQCSNCDTVFSTKQNLKIHVQNQSANPCGQCSAIFCNAHALKGHVYSDHTCKKCHICGENYEYWNLHIESVHGSSSKTK